MITAGKTVITVNLGERSHKIIIEEGVLGRLGDIIRENIDNITGCIVVTNSTIDNLYGACVQDSLERYSPQKVIVQEGEDAKTWVQAGLLIGSILKKGLDRRGLIVALGGGSVGDLAGFVASIYLRGVRIVQVPTTILGMLDSSIGGKTAVNHDDGKNLVGSFYQPSLVVSDPSVLRSLPKRETSSGLSEAVKYGVIADESLFKLLESKQNKLLNIDTYELSKVISICASIKAGYVEADERDDKGIRNALNYGHTVGHAIETVTGHQINHGEAVAIGMVAESQVAMSQGLLTKNDYERQLSLLTGLGLNIKLHSVNLCQVIEYMRRDKKAISGKIRLVLPTGIGSKPILRMVPEKEILKTLEE